MADSELSKNKPEIQNESEDSEEDSPDADFTPLLFSTPLPKVDLKESQTDKTKSPEPDSTTDEPPKQSARKAEPTKRVSFDAPVNIPDQSQDPKKHTSRPTANEQNAPQKSSLKNKDATEVKTIGNKSDIINKAEDSAQENADQSEPAETNEAEIDDDLSQVVDYIVNTSLHIAKSAGLCETSRAAFSWVLGVIPAILIIATYTGVVYAVGTYILEEEELGILPYNARLKLLIRSEVWPLLPVFMATCAALTTNKEVHLKFMRSSFDQALLFLFNLLLASTHVSPNWFIWIRATAMTMAIFSLFNWLLCLGTSKAGSLLTLPAILLNFAAMATNVYIILGQDFGYVTMEPDVVTAATQTGLQDDSSYWDKVTVCNLVEKVFCKVD